MAAGVLVLWGAGLAALGRRELGAGSAARLREAGMRVAPGASYYAIERGEDQIGFASTTVDTSLTGISVMDLRVLQVGSGPGARRAKSYSLVRMTRGLRLTQFTVGFAPGAAARRARGAMSGDTLLTMVVWRGATPDTQRVAVRGPLYFPATVPFAIALGSRPQVERRYDVALFDVALLRPVPATLRIAAESLLVVSDSARLDAGTQRWVSAHDDTLRAWRVEQVGGSLVRGWVDEQGRYVSASLADGTRLRRRAYEAAYLNWPGRRLRAAPPGSTLSSPPGRS